jgi:hypothetical protein
MNKERKKEPFFGELPVHEKKTHPGYLLGNIMVVLQPFANPKRGQGI